MTAHDPTITLLWCSPYTDSDPPAKRAARRGTCGPTGGTSMQPRAQRVRAPERSRALLGEGLVLLQEADLGATDYSGLLHSLAQLG